MNGEWPLSVAIVYPVPVPYSFPVLERISAYDDIALTVYYCRRALPARGGAPVAPMAFSHVFLPSLGIVSVQRDVREVDFNPTVVAALERGRHDVVVVSGFVQPTMLLAIGWAAARRRPYGIMSESHGLRMRGRVRTAVRDAVAGRIVRRASFLLPTSELAVAELLRLGASPASVRLFPHVPDPGTFHSEGRETARRRWRARLGADDELLLAYVGRLVESKGVDTVLRALELLDRPARLVVAGEGPLAGLLRASAPAGVHFVGFLPPTEVADLLRAADALVHPSRDEPFGTIVLEALACGCPVVATEAVPAARAAAAGGASLLFAPGDRAGLAAALERLSPTRLAGLRKAAGRVSADYTVERSAEAFVDGVMHSWSHSSVETSR